MSTAQTEVKVEYAPKLSELGINSAKVVMVCTERDALNAKAVKDFAIRVAQQGGMPDPRQNKVVGPYRYSNVPGATDTDIATSKVACAGFAMEFHFRSRI